jgi:putative transposase
MPSYLLGAQPEVTTITCACNHEWVGNCRRDLLDHVIVVNERHLKQPMFEYARYCREERTHLGLNKETSEGRVAAERANAISKVVTVPRLGGLYHRYDLVA